MATLSKHGDHRQIEYIDHKIALCQDGNVLKNSGDGWKIHAKLKAGINYLTAYENRLEKIREFAAKRPVAAAYKKHMLQWKLSDRRFIFMAFGLLGDDLDGIVSELTERWPRIEIDLEEVREIHHLRQAARKEKERLEAA